MTFVASSFAAALLVALPAPQSPLFPGAEIAVGSGPKAVAVHDLDGDGDRDLVAADALGVSVVLASSPGVFGTSIALPIGGAGLGVAVGNVNDDGFPDVLASTTSGIAVLRGLGGGAFAPFAKSPAPFALGPMAAGDLNGDGRTDVVAGSQSSLQVGVLLGNGSSLVHVAAFPVTQLATRLALGDFDHSGSLDLAVLSGVTTGSIDVLLNDGSGSFVAAPSPAGSASPRDLAIADLDLDADLDLVTVHVAGASGRFEWRLGNGNGTFAPAAGLTFAPSTANAIAVGHFDAGAAPDVIVASSGISVFTNAGLAFTKADVVADGVFAAAAVATDVDGDGRDDVVLASASSSVAVVRGIGGGRLVGVRSYVSPVGDAATSATLADLDLDGRCDVAVGSDFASIRLLFGAPDAAFVPSLDGPLPPFGHAIDDVVAADFDADGLPDLVASESQPSGPSPGKLFFARNDGSGPGAAVLVAEFEFAGSLAAADFDRDGLVDVAVASQHSSGGAVVRSVGAGQFAPPAPLALPGSLHRIDAGDLDANGWIDLVSANVGADDVSVLRNGPGGLSPPASFPAGGPPSAARLADLDGDGDLDVALGLQGAGVARLLGDGLGGLTPGGVLPLPVQFGIVMDLAAADVDADGRVDLVAAIRSTDRIAVYRGTGGGGFAPPLALYPGGNVSPAAVDVNDLDADGWPDLVVANFDFGFGGVAVFRNQRSTPAGISGFGIGTPGCSGALGANAASAPKIGSSEFGIVASNAPPASLGLLLITDAASVAGSDPFGIGLVLHVDLLASATFVALDARSDASGGSTSPLAIPAFPSLAGATVFAQGLWLEAATAPCDPSPFGLVSTRGLALTLQP